MSQNPSRLPALLGGYPIKEDLIPSIICSALYVALLPLFFYRLIRKTSRTTVLFTVLAHIVERSIVFGLRAAISPEPRSDEGFNESAGLMEYLQTTLFMGIVPISQDLAMLVRTILVNATYGSEAAKEIPRLQEQALYSESESDVENAAKSSPLDWREDAVSLKTFQMRSAWSFSGTTVVQEEAEEYPDHPRLRFLFRRTHTGMLFIFLVVFITGLIGNCRLILQRNNPVELRENEILRYVSASLSVAVLLFMNVAVIWARSTMPRLNKNATRYIFLITALLLISAIYRFTVMSKHTTAYYSFESSAQNQLSAKVLFYLIGILPEWLAVLVCLSINVRRVFQTGYDGDTRWRDETPAEKERRLLREKEKELKKGNGLITVPVISKLSRGRFVLPLISS
ncbi:hypothetical protein P691DRAFT_801104 [Macrolepiota fuliginosa MF-IS2]|uniref:Uncharacterized protein n=1 Tax=Macrolepiota fuliginosa MF-IS2 TaxID=1400762 RepID=A0A9P5XBZ1_9AGAR|nr:hypothetical protein P691DRAFT_801104 [Macrolepiota fuliginosa MF-IS2]